MNYVMPQEHGNHYGTKMLRMGGYKVVASEGFEFRVSKFSTAELDRKGHNFQLVPNGYANVRIDYKVSGIGSGSCGPALLHQYRVRDSKVSFKFSIVK